MRVVTAPVLPGDHMFDMKRPERVIGLMNAAVFAPVRGTLCDQDA